MRRHGNRPPVEGLIRDLELRPPYDIQSHGNIRVLDTTKYEKHTKQYEKHTKYLRKTIRNARKNRVSLGGRVSFGEAAEPMDPETMPPVE